MQPDSLRRIKKLTLSGAALVCAGLLYGYILVPLGVAVPCLFHLVTGLRCPGCGVSRMCVALMHFRFREALSYNLGLALCLPFLAYLILRVCAEYIRGGSMTLRRWEEGMAAVLAALLLVWAVLRNIYGL